MKLQSFLTLSAILLMVACTDNNTSGGEVAIGDEPIQLSFRHTYPLQVDEANGTFAHGFVRCKDSGVVDTSFEFKTNYKIQDGKLYTWSKASCNATVYTGASASLRGSWDVLPMQEKVPGTTSANCELREVMEAGESMTQVFGVNTVETQVTMRNWCWSAQYAENLDSTEYAVKADGCDSYSVTHKGKTATNRMVSLNTSSMVLITEFSFQGTTCQKTTVQNRISEASCMSAWNEYKSSGSKEKFYYSDWSDAAAEKQYKDCVAKSGWDADEH